MKDCPQQVPLITVISAVWHQQRDKLELLRGHNANLLAQTVSCRPIYVFDNNDEPPSWLQGTAIRVSEPLTLYQAWNLALAATSTPFVANLNLDDRFATDALEHMIEIFNLYKDVFLVGGDWQVCHSAKETDNFFKAYPAHTLALVSRWPPGPEANRRLGTGDGSNAISYGPACMWRMEAHLAIPRYPYKFGNGFLIRGIADLIWWKMIEHNLKKRLYRLPLIIGNYRSWPESQAEFRYGQEREYIGTGITLI